MPAVWFEVGAEQGAHRATIFVSADALRIGSVEAALRVHVTARTARCLADLLGTLPPTPRTCDLVWQQAHVRSPPCMQIRNAHMAGTDRMVRHSREADEKVRGRAGVVANV
jgi:hypothetical protein